MANTPNPPIEWPRVTIDGVELEVRFSMRIIYRASKAGIDMRKLTGDATSIAQAADLFALCVQHNFEDKGEVAPTGEEWFARLDRMQDMTMCTKAVNAAYALSNLAPAIKTPAKEPAPEQRDLPN